MPTKKKPGVPKVLVGLLRDLPLSSETREGTVYEGAAKDGTVHTFAITNGRWIRSK